MKIYIKESKITLLKESEGEVTFYSFFNNLKNFIQELLNDPVNAKPNEFFKQQGITRSELVKKLLDKGIITKKEDIKEIPSNVNEDNTEVKYIIQYQVPKKNFEKKIHRLYSRLFENTFTHKKSVFNNQDKMITDILSMDKENTYKKRGGLAIPTNKNEEIEKDVVTEDGEGGAGFAGATNANISAAAMFDVPMGGVQRKKFYGDTLKRNKDEKNKSISMNKVGDK